MKSLFLVVLAALSINAATYRVIGNGGRGWQVTQDGGSGTEYKGSYGVQKALRVATAGDSILVYAPNDTSLYTDRIASLTLGTDVTATWQVGDSVQNYTGAGNDWTAVLCSLTTTTAIVELRTGTYTSINIADGIENITRSANTTTSARTIYIILADGADGAYNNRIHIIGSNATFADTQTAIINGNNSNTYNLYLSGQDFLTFKNFNIKRATFSNVAANAATKAPIFYKCLFDSAAQNGVNGANIVDLYLRECTFSYNGYDGITSTSTFAVGVCLFNNNGRCGISTQNRIKASHCIFYTNTRNHILFSNASSSGSNIDNCTFYNTGATYSSINLSVTGIDPVFVSNCRIVGSATYGIALTGTSYVIENDNYYQGNVSGDLSGVAPGLGSITGTDSNYGFADTTAKNFVLSNTATGRSTSLKVGK